MTTPVDLVNQALVLLGGRPVVDSLDGDGDEANIANSVYTTVRDDLLACHPWNFALARAEVEADETAPAFGWSYRYALPEGCLRVWRLTDLPDERLEWVVEGGWLLTNEVGPINLRYISQVTDPASWPPSFQQAMIAALARAMAMAITNTNTVVDMAQRAAAMKLEEARSVNGREHGRTVLSSGRLVVAHRAAAS